MSARALFRKIVFCLAVAASVSAAAAPAPFPTTAFTVKVNGLAVGYGLTPITGNSLRNAVAFDPNTNLYYLYYLGVDTGNDADYSLSNVKVATSSDGVNFNTVLGNLAPPANWWTAIGSLTPTATVEPQFNFLRVQQVGNVWYLFVWNDNFPGSGAYNYNTTVWTLGPSLNNLAPTQVGPLPTSASGGSGGESIGAGGLINGQIYVLQDSTTGGLGRYTYTAGTPPQTNPNFPAPEANLYSGTPWCWGLAAGCTGAPSSYVHNSVRTLSQGGSTIGTYYSFRSYPSGARQEMQLWYVESQDNGQTWSAPAKLFANGAGVTVDGAAVTGDFSYPEVVPVGTGYRTYFSPVVAQGSTFVTSAPTVAQAVTAPALSWYALIGLAALLSTATMLVAARARR